MLNRHALLVRAQPALLVLLPLVIHLPVPGSWQSADPQASLARLAASDWLHGMVPWWNPYSGIGMPLASETPSALFLPFVLLLHWPDGVLLLQVAMQVLTGLATLALLRTLRIAPVIACLCAVLAELDVTLASSALGPGMPAAFLPVLLLGIERARLAVLDRRNAWVLIAVAIAFSAYAGSPQTAWLDGLLGLVFALVRLLTLADPPSRGRFALEIAKGALCGLLLSAPASLGVHADPGTQDVQPGSLAALMLPCILGIAGSHAGGIVGLPVLTLALRSLLGRHRDDALRLALFLWLAVSLAEVAGFPLAVAFWRLVPFVDGTLFPIHAAPSWSFSAILLTALALDDWVRHPQLAHPARAIAALAASLILLDVALWLARPDIERLADAFPLYRLLAGSAAGLTVTAAIAAAALVGSRPRRLRIAALAVVLGLQATTNFAVPLLSAVPATPPDTGPMAFLHAHLGLQRFYSVSGSRPTGGVSERLASINHDAPRMPREWLDYLDAHLGHSLGAALPSNDEALAQAMSPDIATASAVATLAGLGVRYVVAPHGADPFTDSVGTQVRLTGNHPASLAPAASTTVSLPTPRPLAGADIVGVGVEIGTYVGRADGSLAVTLCSGGVCRHGDRTLCGASDNALFQIRLDRPLAVRPDTTLTATLTHQAGTIGVAIYMWPLRSQAGRLPALAFQYRPPGPTPRRVYADPLTDIFALPNAAPYAAIRHGHGHGHGHGHCRVVAIDRRSSIADCDAPGRLVRRELFYPGWRVTVNGEPATLERAGDLFQSVAIPAGRSVVRFSYRPPFLSVASAAMAAGLLWLLTAALAPRAMAGLTSALIALVSARLVPRSGNRATAVLFLSLALPMSAWFALVNPPFQGPDEGAHFLRAIQVGQGGLIASRGQGVHVGGVLPAPLNDLIQSFDYLRFQTHVVVNPAQIRDALAQKWSRSRAFIDFANSAIYPPWFYVPQASAIDFGRLAGLHMIDCLPLARLAAAAAAIAMASLAILRTASGAPFMAAILSLPMTLALFASCAQDALMIATAAMVAAFLSRRAERQASWPAWLLAGLATGALGGARAPYVLLSVLPLIVAWRGPDRRRGLVASMIAASVAVAWLVFGAGPLLVETHAGGSLIGGAQMAYLLAHPWAVPVIAWRTVSVKGWTYFEEFVGVLNWLDVLLPARFYVKAALVLAATFVLSVLAARRTGRTPPRAWIGVVLLATVALIFGALYLSWTSAGAPLVDGVQGRYVIPPALMTVLLLRPGHRAAPTRLATLVVAILLLTELTTIPGIIAAHYRVEAAVAAGWREAKDGALPQAPPKAVAFGNHH